MTCAARRYLLIGLSKTTHRDGSVATALPASPGEAAPRPGAPEPWTKTVWVYDLRTNKHFTLKTKPMARADLDEFFECYRPTDRHNRNATWSDATPEGRWRSYSYDEIVARDKVSLDFSGSGMRA